VLATPSEISNLKSAIVRLLAGGAAFRVPLLSTAAAVEGAAPFTVFVKGAGVDFASMRHVSFLPNRLKDAPFLRGYLAFGLSRSTHNRLAAGRPRRSLKFPCDPGQRAVSPGEANPSSIARGGDIACFIGNARCEF
jgi:hypothetical protein